MNIKRLDINLSIQYLLDNYIEVHQPHNFYCKSNGLYKHGSYAWIVCENRVFIDIKLPQYFDDIYLKLTYKILSFKEIISYEILRESSLDSKIIYETREAIYKSRTASTNLHGYNGFVNKQHLLIKKFVKRFKNEFNI